MAIENYEQAKEIGEAALETAEYNADAMEELFNAKYSYRGGYSGLEDAAQLEFLRDISIVMVANSMRALNLAKVALQFQDDRAHVTRDENFEITDQPPETLRGAARMEYFRAFLEEHGFTREKLYARIIASSHLPNQPAKPSRLFNIRSDAHLSGDAGKVKLYIHKVYVLNIMRIFQGQEFTVRDMLLLEGLDPDSYDSKSRAAQLRNAMQGLAYDLAGASGENRWQSPSVSIETAPNGTTRIYKLEPFVGFLDIGEQDYSYSPESEETIKCTNHESLNREELIQREEARRLKREARAEAAQKERERRAKIAAERKQREMAQKEEARKVADKQRVQAGESRERLDEGVAGVPSSTELLRKMKERMRRERGF